MSKRPPGTPTELLDNDRRFSTRLRDKHRLSGGIVQQPTSLGNNLAQGIGGGNDDEVCVSPAPRLNSSKPDRKRHWASPQLPCLDIITAPPGGTPTVSRGRRTPDGSTSMQECSRRSRQRSKREAGSPGILRSTTPRHTAVSYCEDDSPSAVPPGPALAGPSVVDGAGATRSGKRRKGSGTGSKLARGRLTLGPLCDEASRSKEQCALSKNRVKAGTTTVGCATEPLDIPRLVPFSKAASLIDDLQNTTSIVIRSPHKSEPGASTTVDVSPTTDLSLSNSAKPSSGSSVLSPSEQSVVAQADTHVDRLDTVVRPGNCADPTNVNVPFVKTILAGAVMPTEPINNQNFDTDSPNQEQSIKSWTATSPDPSACLPADYQVIISSDGICQQASIMVTAGGTFRGYDVGFKVRSVDGSSLETHVNGNANVESVVGGLTRRPWTDTSALHDTTWNDSSSGDDLPSVLDGNYLPVVFRKDMLVWYKYQKDPFWPAVIVSSNKAKFVLQFLNYGPPEHSRLAISKKSARERLVEYPGPKHSEYKEAGKQYRDPKAFEVAVNQADDYIRGRALQTITAGPCEHFGALYGKPKAERSARAASAVSHVADSDLTRLECSHPASTGLGIYGSGTPDPAAELDTKSEPDAGSEDSSEAETEDDVVARSDQDRATSAPVFRYSRETEEIIDGRRRYCASLLEILRSDKSRLRELMRSVESGAIDSPFKREFQPDGRRLPVGYRGPIEDDDQYQELFNDLLALYRSDVLPDCDMTSAINAVMYVMLPEVVVHALMEKEGITRAEALSIFRDGVKYTDEELLRPAEISLSSSFARGLVETEERPVHSTE